MRIGIYRRKPVTGLCNKSVIRFACPVASFALLPGCGGFIRSANWRRQRVRLKAILV